MLKAADLLSRMEGMTDESKIVFLATMLSDHVGTSMIVGGVGLLSLLLGGKLDLPDQRHP